MTHKLAKKTPLGRPKDIRRVTLQQEKFGSSDFGK
jgi:hypothetical protein